MSATDTSSKHGWVVPLINKQDIAITNAFQKILDEPGHKPNKIWVDKGSEFYNKSFKSWPQNNNIEMYWTHNVNQLLLLRDLKDKIYKYLTSILKNVWIDKMGNIVKIV